MKIKNVIITFAILIFSALQNYGQWGSANITSSYYTTGPFVNNSTLIGQCTWFAYGRIQETGLIPLTVLSSTGIFRSNADNWGNEAVQVGFATGNTAAAGALAVYYMRHVAFVDAVNQYTESNNTPRVGDDVVIARISNLRSSPTTTSLPVKWEMPRFTIMRIVAGPTEADNFQWFQMTGNGQTGWAAWQEMSPAGRANPTSYYWNFTRIKIAPGTPFFISQPDIYIYPNSKPILPLNNSTNISSNTTLSWTPINGAVYWLQVSKNSTYTDLVINQKNINSTTYQIQLAPNTKYWWRVHIGTPSTTTKWEGWNFTTHSATTTLEVTPTSLTLGSASSSIGQIIVSSNVSWTASDNATWLSVSPTSGSNNGTITVTATSENTSTSSRSGSVTISGGGITRTVSVTQNGATTILEVTPTSLNFGNQQVNTNSSPQSYTVSGSNLTANITISTPTGFQVSSSQASGYSSSVTLSHTNGTVNSPVIWVRFTPTEMRSYSGNITHTSGAASQNVSVSGTGIPTPPSSSIKPVTASSNIQKGTDFWVEVKVGDPNTISDLYGISFKLASNNGNCTYVDGSAENGGFLGGSPILFTRQINSQTVDLAVTKSSSHGVSGSGIVAKVKFTTPQTLQKDEIVTFHLTDVAANSSKGLPIPINVNTLSVTITTSKLVLVFPGDCNNDGVVSGTDVLPIGLFYSQERPAENKPGIQPNVYHREPWATDSGTPKRIYADANGDGVINASDVLAIGFNYGKTHTPSNSIYFSVSPSNSETLNNSTFHSNLNPSIKPSGSTSVKNNTEFYVNVRIEDTVPITDLFGISFKLKSNKTTCTYVENSGEKGSFFNGNELTFFQKVDPQTVDAAITKTSAPGLNGSGVVARFKFISSIDQTVNFSMTHVSATDSKGNTIALSIIAADIQVDIYKEAEIPALMPLSSSGSIITLAQGLNRPFNLSIDGNFVYWVENDLSAGAVKKIPLTGGSISTLATNLIEPTAIVVDASFVYWIERNNGSNGSLKKIPINGGSVTTLATGLNNAQNHMVQDALHLYFGDGISGGGGAIRKVPKGGGAIITLVNSGIINLRTAIAVDDSYVYFTDDQNNIKRVPKTGGSVSIIGIGNPSAMILYNNDIYWVEYSNGSVKKMPKSGGAVTTLASGSNSPAGIATDGSSVYWIEFNNPGKVWKVSVNGGSTTIISNEANTIGIVAGNQGAYWAVSHFLNQGKIQKLENIIIAIQPALIAFGNVAVNTNSTAQSYTVSGSNLTENIVITAPSGFQISTNQTSGFGSSVTLQQTNGTVSNTAIWVRFSPTAVQSFSGNVANTSFGATTQNVAVSGTGANVPAIVITPIDTQPLAFGNQQINTNSSPKSYSVSGNYLTANITITAPIGFQASSNQNSGFASSVSIPQINGTVNNTIIWIRFSPSEVKSYSGNISNASTGLTTKNVAVNGVGLLVNSNPSLKPSGPTSVKNNTEFYIDVRIEETVPITDLYGISFNLKSNRTTCIYIENSGEKGSFFSGNVISFFRHVDPQTVDAAVTKTSAPGINGSGIVARFKYKSSVDQLVNFSITNVSATDSKGNTIVLNVKAADVLVDIQKEEVLPSAFSLMQNYPNPFNPNTTIKFSIPHSQFVTLKVYDILGREVATLVNEEKLHGNYEVKFDGSALPSGTYFYRLQAGIFSQTKKLLLLK